MKEITGTWIKAVRDMFDNETPFAHIIVEEDRRRVTVYMYWTKGGTYGRQVRTIAFTATKEIRNECRVYTHLTSGCGYNKKIAALEHVASELNIQCLADSGSFAAEKWHVGGNYHFIDLRAGKSQNALLDAAKDVVERWESGDLAEAVRRLSTMIEETEG